MLNPLVWFDGDEILAAKCQAAQVISLDLSHLLMDRTWPLDLLANTYHMSATPNENYS